jgi:hypothetical protein
MFDDEDDGEVLQCATYTHARRHPMVLGHIGGWTPPFQLTLPQIGVIFGTFWFEGQTWRFWGAYLPRTVGFALVISLPVVLAWVVRRTRIEGRSLPRALLGYASLLWTPKDGQVGGRPNRESRAAHPGLTHVYVDGGEVGR